MKRKQITVRIESREDHDEITYTRVSIYNSHLADIYFLEEPEGYRYCIDYGYGCWDRETYETELDAVRRVVRHYGLNGSYHNIPVRMGYYCNSESGAITYRDNIQAVNLAAA
jgi:hypothetical protein